MSKWKIQPWMDRPTCPYCGSATGVGASVYGNDTPGTLKCLACGEYFQGTPEQLEQARKADAAWDRARKEGVVKAPRSMHQLRRRKKPTDQLGLFGNGKVE